MGSAQPGVGLLRTSGLAMDLLSGVCVSPLLCLVPSPPLGWLWWIPRRGCSVGSTQRACGAFRGTHTKRPLPCPQEVCTGCCRGFGHPMALISWINPGGARAECEDPSPVGRERWPGPSGSPGSARPRRLRGPCSEQ